MEPLSAFAQSLVEQYISHASSEEMHGKARETVKAGLKERIEKLCTKECENATSCENAVSAIQVVEGYPDQVILDVAKEYSADLIIMGTYSHNIVSKVMGSTTRRVLNRASQPVLVVKIPEGYKRHRSHEVLPTWENILSIGKEEDERPDANNKSGRSSGSTSTF